MSMVHSLNPPLHTVAYRYSAFLHCECALLWTSAPNSRCSRRMVCSLNCPSSDEPIMTNTPKFAKSKSAAASAGLTVLRNKAPRWHDNLQCRCLNFHGRVTVESLKNFQLVATMDQSQPGGKGDGETVLLQFGKVGDDLFTMDYRQPSWPDYRQPSWPVSDNNML